MISYDALIGYTGHYSHFSKRDRHKYKECGWKKNDMKLHLESSRISATELFSESC